MVLLTGNIYVDLLTITLATTAIILFFLKRSFNFWKNQDVYTLSPSLPFGNANNLVFQRKTIGVEMKDVYEKFKKQGLKYGGYYFFAKPIFIPVDLELVKMMMTKDFVHFTNHVNHIDEDLEPITGHLFSLKGQKWRNLRQKLSPTFTSGKMKMMFPTLIDCSKLLEIVMDEICEKGDPIEIKEIIARFTTDIISSCAFGIECGCLKNPNSDFRVYGRKVFDRSLSLSIVRLLTFTFPPIISLLRLRTFPKEVSDFFMGLAKDMVEQREKNNIIRKDFMHLLIQLKNNVNIKEDDVGELKSANKSDGTSLTLNELSAQSFVFFVAGYETSSTTSTFLLYELAVNQDCQEKLRQEVYSVLEKHEGKITYEALMEMPYMDKCIYEALRKYPPVPIHTRECTQTYKVPNSDIVLKKGQFVFIPNMGIHYDPEHWPDPEKFDPERFSEENKAKRHPSAWTPFGDGPRLCIGLRFGVMQTKVGLAVLLKSYRFTLHSRTKSPLTFDPVNLVLNAESGVWLNVEKI